MSAVMPAPSSGRVGRLMVAALALGIVTAAVSSGRQAAHASEEADADRSLGQLDASQALSHLRHQPLESAALRDLAYARSGSGDGGRGLLELSDKVSRRDPASQLWLIETRVSDGDVPATLRHYDALLSTTPQLAGQLLPVLASAATDPAIRMQLAPYVRRSWFAALVETIAGRTGQALLALELARKGSMLQHAQGRSDLTPRLISALVAEKYTAEAATLARSTVGDGWQQPGFTATTVDPRLGALGWRLEDSTSASAQWRTPDTVTFSVGPGLRVAAARRVTLLPPGRYTLSLSVSAPAEPAARLDWLVACEAQSGRDSLRFSLAPRPNQEVVRKDLILPTGCLSQEWTVWVEGADAQALSGAELSSLELRRQ